MIILMRSCYSSVPGRVHGYLIFWESFFVQEEMTCPSRDRDPSCSRSLPVVDLEDQTLEEATDIKDVAIPMDDSIIDKDRDHPLE